MWEPKAHRAAAAASDFATQFFLGCFFFFCPFWISSYFQKINKNIYTAPGAPVFGAMASPGTPLSFPTIVKIPQRGVPPALGPRFGKGGRWGGESLDPQQEKMVSKNDQKSNPGRKGENFT